MSKDFEKRIAAFCDKIPPLTLFILAFLSKDCYTIAIFITATVISFQGYLQIIQTDIEIEIEV